MNRAIIIHGWEETPEGQWLPWVSKTLQEKGHTEIVLNSGPRYKDTGWGFYDRLPGYLRVGIATGYYGKGGDAPVWRKEL